MIRHTHSHFSWPNERDRYFYDRTLAGYAQVDTRQDAPYFGLWANPTELKIVCFCEGDETITTCDTDTDFAAEMWGIKSHYGEGFKGIDPGWPQREVTKQITAAFESLGLQDLLYVEYKTLLH